jgi:tRNA threonylcarbamoyladenosine biosynthesis protein TsaB
LKILALDTSSAAGSAAIVRGDAIVLARAGDGSRTHGERLPRELMTLLDDARVSLDEIDTFAVATGPGSFTGLRIGIAAIQGLALAQGKLVVPVSTFEALAAEFRLKAETTGERFRTSDLGPRTSDAIAAWIDAHRGEVFATLYGPDGEVLQAPTSLTPEATLDAWSASLGETGTIRFAGDGAVKCRTAIEARLGARADIQAAVPALAGAIGLLAAREPGRAVRPHAVVPLYVRRSDAELARDRRHASGSV